MAIFIYSANETDFTHNGLGDLTPTACTVEEHANGMYALSMAHPIDETGKWTKIANNCVLKVPVPVRTTPEINISVPDTPIIDGNYEIWKVKTQGGRLNVRSGAGTSYKSIALLKIGTEVAVVQKNQLGTKLRWATAQPVGVTLVILNL